MKRYTPVALAVAAIIVSGTVHGFWTGRWHLTQTTQPVAARLSSVSQELGDWQGENLPLDARQEEPDTAQLSRRYVHRRTGKMVTVYLVCGRPGPIAVHTPDVCYAAGGFQVTSQTKYSLPEPPAELETALMTKKRVADQMRLRIFWSWSGTGGWSVPENPRLTFARYPMLYKLYVLRELSQVSEPLDDDPCIDLMRQLLPELQKRLFSET
jgi:hypothetical protein